MPTVPTTRDAIRAAIAADGPMTTQALARKLNKPQGTITSAITCARKKPGRFPIVGWERSTGTRGRLKPVYGVGGKSDVPPPVKLTRKEINATYQRKWASVLKLKHRARCGRAVTWLPGLL